MRIVTEKIPYVKSASFGIWVKTGSRNEKDDEHGISHFIEHMQFKGTKLRSAFEISEAFEKIGAQVNAYTTKEYTCFLLKVLGEYLFDAADILCDMFFNSIYSSVDIENEKKVIIEEIKSYEDMPEEIVHEYFAKAFFDGHPLGKPILGTIESVSSFTKNKVFNFLEREYVGGNIIISVSGNVDHNEVVDRLGYLFENNIPSGGNFVYIPPEIKPRVIIKYKNSEQVQICIGTPALPHTDENIYTLTVLNNILGGSLSSRLFQEIREKRSLAYSIYSYNVSFFDCGLWGIHTGTSSNNVYSVLEICLNIIASIKENGVKEDELERAKQQLRGELLLSMENTMNHMSRLGKSELTHNRVITIDEMVEKVMAVSLEQVYELAKKLFVPENFGLALIGPFRGDIDLKATIKKFGIC